MAFLLPDKVFSCPVHSYLTLFSQNCSCPGMLAVNFFTAMAQKIQNKKRYFFTLSFPKIQLLSGNFIS